MDIDREIILMRTTNMMLIMIGISSIGLHFGYWRSNSFEVLSFDDGSEKDKKFKY